MFYRTSNKVAISIAVPLISGVISAAVFYLIVTVESEYELMLDRFFAIWGMAMITVPFIYLFNRKHRIYDVKASAQKVTFQLTMCVLAAIVGSATIAFTENLMTSNILSWEAFLYMAVSAFGILLLAIGIMRWMGIVGLPLAGLICLLMAPIYIRGYEMVMLLLAVAGIATAYLSLLWKDDMRWQDQFLFQEGQKKVEEDEGTL